MRAWIALEAPHGFNGMEYSVTLIAALLATVLTAPGRRA